MIKTGLPRIPWLWVLMLCTVSGIAHLIDAAVSSAPMAKLLEPYTTHPLVLSLISDIGLAMAILVSPYVSWKSDRIWTRFGRRKPFILTGLGMAIIGLLAAPLVGNIWALLFVIVILYVGHDMGYQGPFAPLLYEVVPSPQRGRATVAKKAFSDIFKLASGYFLLSQWKHIYAIPSPKWLTDLLHIQPFHIHFTGAHVLYYVTAFGAAIIWVGIALWVQETKPTAPVMRERFSPLRFFRDLFGDKQMLMVAMLLFCGTTLSVSLSGYLTTQMLTLQFHYSMETLGKTINFWTYIIILVGVMPVALFVSDRIERRLLYRWGLLLGTLHHLLMWLVIKYVGIPHVNLWIALVGVGYLVDLTAGLALEPLVFDMVPRAKMGTINSGFLLINKILGMVIAPIVGFFIAVCSYTTYGWGTKQWDYSSGFLVYFILGALGCALYFFYVEPHWKQGNLTAALTDGTPTQEANPTTDTKKQP